MTALTGAGLALAVVVWLVLAIPAGVLLGRLVRSIGEDIEHRR